MASKAAERLARMIGLKEIKAMERMLEILDLTATHPDRIIPWELKVVCPSCHTYAMLLKSDGYEGPRYYCLECGSEGLLEDLYNDLLGKEISKPRGISL